MSFSSPRPPACTLLAFTDEWARRGRESFTGSFRAARQNAGRGTFAIDVEPLVFGRDPGANIVVADPEVSAFHCELPAVSEGILVIDLGSTNGTPLSSLAKRCKGNVSEMARQSGMERHHVRAYLRKYRIEKSPS